MTRLTPLFLACLFLVGCSNYDKAKELADQMVANLTEVVVALEQVKDKASAQAAAKKIDEIGLKMDAIVKEEKQVKVTMAEKKKLDAYVDGKLKTIDARMTAAVNKAVGIDPSLRAKIVDLGLRMMGNR